MFMAAEDSNFFSDAWDSIKKFPNTVMGVFKKDGDNVNEAKSEKADTPTDYGKDLGDNFWTKAITAGVGAFLGGSISNNVSGGNKLWMGIGGLAGAVILHKIGPELVTDVQRGLQYDNQQVALGKSEGKFMDKFNAVFGNIKVKGQDYAPSVGADPDVDM